jgi:hypothetical protein
MLLEKIGKGVEVYEMDAEKIKGAINELQVRQSQLMRHVA